MMEVTAIHQRLANAVARVGGMVEGEKLQAERGKEPEERNVEGRERENKRETNEEERKAHRASLTDAQVEGSLITYL